jgi:predicted ATPase/class 3 adenylate cyclase
MSLVPTPRSVPATDVGAMRGGPSFSDRAGVESPQSTFLLTDIEGSTRLWEENGGSMGAALGQHDKLLRQAIEEHGGAVIKTTGDGMLAVFADPVSGVDAALEAQRTLRDATWGETGQLRVRMALHAGAAETRDGDYFGPALNRVARILAIGHGGQVICSAVAAVLARDGLPTSVDLLDLGSHRLRDMDRPEQVYQVVVDDLPRTFPPLRSLSTRRSNLPVQLTSFVGREKQLAEVVDLIGRHRLVTLIGTGGTGKTRLMLEVAGHLLERYPDGVWLAELAPLGDVSQIPSEVARALGAPEIPGVPAIATIAAFLAEKDLLLLLDNAEHLVDGVAHLAERLLGTAPGLRILTTSREALSIQGEAVLQLQSLSCPSVVFTRAGVANDPVNLDEAAATEAVRLFIERATAVDPEFRLGDSNVASVAEICRRLDGIPLAIELAAARVSAMSPDDIARRLGDRFRLLAGGRRTAVPRQQTLHALIDWSWDLLTEEDRQLLRRLSVFTGGWTIPMAARIVGDDPNGIDAVDLADGLTRLVDRSLVILDRGTRTRYRMLETIRQYAREKLIDAGEAAMLSDRHLDVYAAFAVEAEEPMRGPAMVDWLDRLDAELDNLGAALEWGLEAAPWTAARMASALMGYWAVRVISQDNDARIVAAIETVRTWVAGRPAVDSAHKVLAARLLGEAARLWAMSGRAVMAIPWAEEALALADETGDPIARLYALAGLGTATVFAGQAGRGGAETRRVFEEATELAEKQGMWWMLALVAGFSGSGLAVFDANAGGALLRRAVDAAERSGSPYAIGAVSLAQGRALGRLGQTDAAVASFGVAIQRLLELGDERFVLAARSDMAHALRRGGRLDEALAVYHETIGGWIHLGHKGAVANQLENIAYVAVEQGDPDQAVRLLGAAQAIREVGRSQMAFDEEPEYAAFLERARTAMAPTAFEEAWTAGGALSQSDAVAVALAENPWRIGT